MNPAGLILRSDQIECLEAIDVATVKRTATGKGNADKLAMIAAANARWSLSLGPKDDDEADARWIAETAGQQFGSKAVSTPAAPAERRLAELFAFIAEKAKEQR